MTEPLREVAARFSVEADASKLTAMDSAIETAIGKLSKFGAALAGGAIARAALAFGKRLADAGDELEEASQRLGTNTKDLQVWRHAAGLAGVSAGGLETALQTLSKNAEIGGKPGQTLKKLGVDALDAAGNVRPMGQLLPELAEGFSKISNPSERTAKALQIFGRQGAKLLPLLAEGAEGLAKYRQEFEDLGGGLSEDLVHEAAAYNDELARFDLAITSVESKLGVLLLPALRALVEVGTKATAVFNKLAKESEILEAALIVLGTAALVAGRNMLVGLLLPLFKVAAVTALFVVLTLLVEDLIKLFKGGGSVVGDFIDDMLGVGAAVEIVEALKESWASLGENIALAVAGAQDFAALASGDTKGWHHLEDTRKAQAELRERDSQTRGVKLLNRTEAKAARLDPAEKARQRARAAETGDLDAFVKLRDGGSPAEAFEAFKGQRKAVVESGRVKANATDVSTFGAKSVQVGEKRRAEGAVIQNTVTINLPPGAPGQVAEDVKKAMQEVLDKSNRRTAATLGAI